MKIWYITSEYPPDFGGGISMYIDQVSKMFANNGHDVTVFVRSESETKVEQVFPNLRVVRFQHIRREQYAFLGYWTALSYDYAQVVMEYMKNETPPDMIEVPDYNALGYYLLNYKWLKYDIIKDIPIVVHLHTPTFELATINQSTRYEFPTYWIGQMEKQSIRSASGIVTQSEFLANRIKPYAGNKEINVIPLPYETNMEQSSQPEVKQYDVLFLGRTEYRKGIIHLLKEADRCWSEGKEFTLKVIGGDTFFEPKNQMLGVELKERYTKHINENRLIFQNSVPPTELVKEIKKAKMVVIPSLYENYPYNCIIAMSLGIPVLVSKSGGQAEMVGITGENGFVFDWSTPGDFKEKLYDALAKGDEELAQIGRNGQKRITDLTNLEDNYNRRLDFYKTIITNEKPENRFPISDTINTEWVEKNREINGEKGLISIIIPFYNLGRLLLETLKSAQNIDYNNYEVIIINDGSTDSESINVLKEIEARKEPKIRIVSIENQGLANARNVGAMEAKGEYVAFLDADDLIEPNFYSKCIGLLQEYCNVSFVYSWVKYFGNVNSVWPTFNTEFPYLLGMNMLTAFVVVRKDDFLKYGQNRIEMEYGMEDFDGWVSMCAAGCAGISIPETLVHYRVRSDSMSRQFNRKKVVYLLDKLSSGHPEVYQKHGLEIYNLLVANGPGYLWNNPTFSHPDVVYQLNQPIENAPIDLNTAKNELIRISNSDLGRKIINIMFKLKVNKLFK